MARPLGAQTLNSERCKASPSSARPIVCVCGSVMCVCVFRFPRFVCVVASTPTTAPMPSKHFYDMRDLPLISLLAPCLLQRSLQPAQCRRFRAVRLGATGNFELDLFSPAKVTIFNRVVKRHDDGCHEVASLHHCVTFGDRLLLARIPADRFAAAGVVRPSRTTEPIKQHAELTVTTETAGAEQVPLDESNHVVRALALFRTRLAQRDGGSLQVPRFRAHIVKRVPPGSGLGGAASNAATALWGANELCGRPASAEELVEWSHDIGGDVACFLAGEGAALCSGKAIFHKPPGVRAVDPRRLSVPTGGAAGGDAGGDAGGERLYVITPMGGAPLSTPRLFRLLADSSYSTLSDAPPAELLERFGQAGATAEGRAAGMEAYVNDLEPAALSSSSALGALKRHLLGSGGFRLAVMSGAGPSFAAVGRLRDGDDEDAFAARLAAECAAHTELPSVQVRRVDFASRVGEQWYAEPGVDVDDA